MWILFAPLLGCSATDTGTNPTDSVSPTDSAAGDSATDDTATTPTGWQTLPDDCTPPTPSGVDPFQLEGELSLTQETHGSWFVEILDIAWLPDQERVLAVGQGGLVVYDAAPGADPVLAGHTGPDASGSERYYHLLPAGDDRVWVTHRARGVTLINTDPSVLEPVAEAEGLGFEGLDQGGTWLYVASTEGTVEVFDASGTDQVVPHGSVAGLGRPWDVLVSGAVAWVADGERGVVALDLADPGAPSLAGEAATEGTPSRLATDGAGTLYLAAGAAGVEVYDVSDPLAPVRVGAVDVGGSALDVAVDGSLLGVATQEAVVLLDLTDPLAPAPWAYQETEQYAMTLDASEGLWTVGDWNILGLWRAGTAPAPAIDPSVDTVALLDGSETRELTITNRGAATLTLTGVDVPAGVTAQVSATSIGPGDQALLSLTWDGTTSVDDAAVCVASDDPGRPAVAIGLTTGQDGEGQGIGQQAPDFSLPDLDGITRRLSEERGHPVVLAYFATW